MPKILIVDDDFDNRNILKEALEAAGFETLQAENGQEAIDLAVKEIPDLIFMDLSMPKMNGWTAAKQIKQLPQLAHVPIFAFTAHAFAEDETRAKAAGCDDYISKPCIPREVIEKVKTWLRKGNA